MSTSSPVMPVAQPPSYAQPETQQARHPGQQPPQDQQHHHPASTTSSLNGFYQAIQQMHGQADGVGKDGEHPSTTNISLFSPWSNFCGTGVPNYPFPSPSLGFTIGDTFVPWSDAVGPSGLTPTPGQTMAQGYPMHSMHPQLQGGGGRDDAFNKADGAAFLPGGLPFPSMNMDASATTAGGEKLQGAINDLRKESIASGTAEGGPGSVSRVDSSSSGASAASGLVDANARTPTPLFKSREPLRSFESTGSYFTYPRPGGGDQLPSSYQPQMSAQQQQAHGQTKGAVQPAQLFHLNQPFQAAAYASNPYMGVPPTLTQHPSSHAQHHGYLHQQHQPDRQNSRASTSSEVSSISPAMLNSRAPRTGSPVSMTSDDALHPISAQTSPRSQAPRQLAGGSGSGSNNPVRPGRQHHTSGPGSSLNLKRGSASSMHTDVDGEDFLDPDDDEADGVEKNGMMWGMPTAAYRSLTARERKRVRNRISARTFRARRKEHLSVLEQDLNDRNALLKASQDEIKKLREENAELQRRVAMYENGQHR